MIREIYEYEVTRSKIGREADNFTSSYISVKYPDAESWKDREREWYLVSTAFGHTEDGDFMFFTWRRKVVKGDYVNY